MTYQSGTGGAGMSDWLLGTVRKNPEGLLLLAAGAVLLMRKSTPSRTYQAETPHFPQSGGFREATTDMQESGRGFAQQVKEKASSFASSASETASSFASSASEYAEQQPLLVAVAGIAAGAAIAAAFPATAIERQTLGPIGDQLSDAASRVGGQLQEATAKAGEKLKSAVEERGLNADGLKEVVTDAAGAFSDSMSGKKDHGSGSGFESPPFSQPGSIENR